MPKMLDKFWVNGFRSLQNQSKGYCLMVLNKMLVFNKIYSWTILGKPYQYVFIVFITEDPYFFSISLSDCFNLSARIIKALSENYF